MNSLKKTNLNEFNKHQSDHRGLRI